MNFLFIFLAAFATYGILSIKRPVYGLIAFILVLIWEEPIISFYQMPAWIIQLAGAVLIFGFMVNHVINSRRFPLRLHQFHFWFLIFIAYFIARNPSLAFESPIDGRNWVFTYSQLLIFTIITPSCLIEVKDLIRLMWGIIIGITLYGLWFVLSSTESIGMVSEGDFGSANSVARYIVISMVFCIYLLSKPTVRRVRVILLSIFVFQLVVLFLTESRTMLLLLVLVTIFLLTRVFRFNFRVTIVSAVVIGAGLIIIPPEVVDRFIGTLTGEAYSGSKQTAQLQSLTQNIRFLFWQKGFEMMADYSIFFGIGIGNFRVLITDYLSFLDQGLDTHNTYLSILFEHGIIGFLIFGMMLRHSFKSYGVSLNFLRSFNKRNWKLGEFNIWNVFVLTLFIVLIGGLSKHDHYNKLFFLLLSLGLGFRYYIDPVELNENPASS